MAEIIDISTVDIDFQKGVCAVCKKKKVERWCDFVTKYQHTIFFFRKWQDFKESNTYGTQHQQCNLPMCEDCATEQTGDMHLCPHHQALMDKAEQPDDYLKMRQQREFLKIYEDLKASVKPLEGEPMNDSRFYHQVQEIAQRNDVLEHENKRLEKRLAELEREIASGQMRLF